MGILMNPCVNATLTKLSEIISIMRSKVSAKFQTTSVLENALTSQMFQTYELVRAIQESSFVIFLFRTAGPQLT